MKKLIPVIVLVLLASLFIFNKQNDTVYEYKGKKVSENEYYEFLNDYYGPYFGFKIIEKEYLSKIEIDPITQEAIKSELEGILENNNTEEGKIMLEASLRSYGYESMDELELYLRNTEAKQKLLKENMVKYKEEFTEFIENYKPRVLSHILIVDEELNSTEINAKMNEIDAVLEKSDNIKIDMIKLGDGEVIIGESLGYVDKETNFDPAFLEAALELENEELSGWIKSDFGYHRILLETTDIEELVKYDDFVSKTVMTSPKTEVKIFLDLFEEEGIEISDEFKTRIDLMLNEGNTDYDLDLSDKTALFKINGKSYTDKDIFDFIIKLDYGQYLIRELENDVIDTIQNDHDYNIEDRMKEQLKQFEDYAEMIGIDMESLALYYGFEDYDAFYKEIEKSVIIDVYSTEIIDENYDVLIKRYDIKAINIYTVDNKETTVQMQRYIQNDYEMDKFEDEFEFVSKNKVIFNNEMEDYDLRLDTIDDDKIFVDSEDEKIYYVYVLDFEELDHDAAVNAILYETSFNQSMISDAIKENGLVIHNKSLKKNMMQDFSQYIK